MSLLEDKDFKSVLAYAKSVAHACHIDSLSIDHLRVGLLLSVRAGAVKIIKRLEVGQVACCESASRSLRFDLSTPLGRLQKGKWSLEADLRSFIASAKDEGFAGFVARLCKDNNNLPMPSPPLNDSGASAREDRHFGLILLCAHSIAERHSVGHITPDVFAAGTLLAHQGGLLSSRPAVVHAVTANASNADALLKNRRWSLEGLSPKSALLDIPEAPEFVDHIQKSAAHADPLVFVVNRGMAEGAEVLLRERIAYHEAGHAIANLVLIPERAIAEVTIVPKNEADGYVAYDESSPWNTAPTSKEDVLEILQVSLAGRVAEQCKAGHSAGIDAGATSDLRYATDTAWRAITEWGMDDDFGPVALGACVKEGAPNSGWLFDEAQRSLQRVMKKAHSSVEVLIEKNWQHVETLAQLLLEKSRLSQDELLAVLPELVSSETRIVKDSGNEEPKK